MPEAARGDGGETVDTVHPAAGRKNEISCNAVPIVTATDACSSKVTVEGKGIVRQGDAVKSHPFPSCATHAPGLTSGSSKVTVEGKAAGRRGDTYGCGAKITSGSSKVRIG